MKLLDQPLVKGDRVLIAIEGYKDIPKSTLIEIPESITERRSLGCEVGHVLEIGKDAYVRKSATEPYCVPGDYVLFVQYAGKEYRHPDTKKLYRIIKDDDVLAVIGKEESEL